MSGRKQGWEARLAAIVEAASDRPFVWGTHDCCTFAAACVDAVLGGDFVAQLADLYTDEASARRYLEARGGLRSATTAILGEPVDRWALARRGDVCLVPAEQGPGLGVCIGHRIALPGERGLALYSLSVALCVWRVGDA